ncbi:MAG: hypothetical protein AB1750_11880 [Chloroflexota bacterium]
MDNPLFLAFFFGIFHLLGGLAFGRGLRDWRADHDKSLTLVYLGLFLGGGAALFNWFFLLREGQTLFGLAGPAVFGLAAFAAFFLWTGELSRKNEKSIVTLAMGIVAVLIGLFVTPILIAQAQTQELTLADWIFGPCIAILPFFVGINFIYLAAKALRTTRAFDEVAAEEEAKQDKALEDRKKRK